MYLSFSTLPSLRTNAPQFVASLDDGFSGLTKYLLDSGKKALADIRSSSLAGRVNWKIALPVCLLVLAATSCIFYLVKHNNALKTQVNQLNADNATISGLKGQISTLEQERDKISNELAQKTEEPSDLAPQLAELQEKIKQLEEQISAHEQEKGPIVNESAQQSEEADHKLAELEETIKQLTAQISSFEEEAKLADGSVLQLQESNLKIAEQEKTIEQLNAKISSLEAENEKSKSNKINTLLKKEQAASKELSEKLEALKKEHSTPSTAQETLQAEYNSLYERSSLINKENTELKAYNKQLEEALQEIAAQGQEEDE